MADEDPFDKFQQTYSLLAKSVPLPLDQINRQLRDAIQNALQPLSDVHAQVGATLKLTIELRDKAQAVLPLVVQQLDELVSSLDMDDLSRKSTGLRMLTNSFHEAVQDPTAIFPQLVCGEVPVDPVRVISFRKRYARLEHLHELDPDLNFEDRSMPVVPKSGLDVITNITSSLESFTDAVHSAIEAVQEVADAIGRAKEGVGNIDVSGVLEDLGKMKDDIKAFWEAATGEETEPMDVMKLVRETMERLKGMEKGLRERLERLGNGGDDLLRLAVRLEDIVNGVEREVGRMIEKVGRLDTNIPRIERELRAFFWPTGLQGLILRPSFVLEGLLKGLDEAKRDIGEIVDVEARDLGAVQVRECLQTVEQVREGLEELMTGYQNDIMSRVTEALEEELAKLCSEVEETFEDGIENTLESMNQALRAENTTVSQVVAWGIDKLFT